MVKDYVFELEGIVETEDVLQAYTKRYAQADFSDVPKLDLVYGIKESSEAAGKKGEVDRKEGESAADMSRNAYQIDTGEGILQVSGADGIWKEVPVALQEFLERGDEMEGKLTSLQPGSYQVDENKIIFAYGGDSEVPFSVVFYDEESQSFNKSVVRYDFYGGR